MCMDIIMPILAAGINTPVVVTGRRQQPFVRGDHVRPDAVNIRGMGEIHHVGRITAGRAHVDFQADEITDFTQPFTGFVQAEEFKMDIAAADIESLQRSPSEFPESFRDIRVDIVKQVQIVIDDVCDGRKLFWNAERRCH